MIGCVLSDLGVKKSYPKVKYYLGVICFLIIGQGCVTVLGNKFRFLTLRIQLRIGLTAQELRLESTKLMPSEAYNHLGKSATAR